MNHPKQLLAALFIMFYTPVCCAAIIEVENYKYSINPGAKGNTMHEPVDKFEILSTILRLETGATRCRAVVKGVTAGWNGGNDWSFHNMGDVNFPWGSGERDSGYQKQLTPWYTDEFLHLSLGLGDGGFLECDRQFPADAYLSVEALVNQDNDRSPPFYLGHHVPLSSLVTPIRTQKKRASVPDETHLLPGRNAFVKGDIKNVRLIQDGKETKSIVLTSSSEMTTYAAYDDRTGELLWNPDDGLTAGKYHATITAKIILD